MSESDKVNGDLTDAKSVNTVPSSQRKPRINRRSFHLSNNPLKDLTTVASELFTEKKPNQLNADVNGCNDGTESKKTESSQKRIISLSSVKSSIGSADKSSSSKGKEGNIISLKKSSIPSALNTVKREITSKTEDSSSADPPAKKKHKPITWP